MRWLLLTILLIVLTAFSGQEVERVPWQQGRLLTWEDFQGTPHKHNHHDAQAHCMLDASIQSDGSEVQFDVRAYFLPEASWTRTTRDADLLKHEQLHFDIAEWHARQLRKRLVHLVKKDADLAQLFDQVFENVNREMKLMQDRYDRETRHGSRKKIQEEWTSRVNEELKALDQYATPDHTIALQ